MFKSISSLHSVLWVLCFLPSLLIAQDSVKKSREEILKELYEKKMHFENTGETPQNTGQAFKNKNSSETDISNNALAESEIHAAINPNDSSKIIVSAIKRNLANGLFTPVYYTGDYGKTWQESNFKTSSNAANGGGDPVLAYNDNGRAFLSWISVSGQQSNTKWGMYWAYSDDNGQTWNRGNDTIFFKTGDITSLDGVADKQWMAVDRSPTSNYYNNLYVVYSKLGGIGANSEIIVKTKEAGELTFNDQSASFGSDFIRVHFSDIKVDVNGEVHVTFWGIKRFQGGSGIYHTISKDGGQSFSTPTKVSDMYLYKYDNNDPEADTITGIKNDRLYPSPHLAVDNSNGPNQGNIYVTWTAQGVGQKSTEGTDIYFSKSQDGGLTWSDAKDITVDNKPKLHQFYSNIDVNPDGKVVLSWYDRQEDPNNELTHYYSAFSSDGGETFRGHNAVSKQPTDFSTVGSKNNGFGIGEYNEVLTTSTHVIPFWSDGRNNNGDLDIMTAFVPYEEFPTSKARYTSINGDFSITKLYPNPASSKLNIDYKAQKTQSLNIRILNPQGKLVKRIQNRSVTKGESKLELDLTQLKPGAYFLSIDGANGIYAAPFEVK